MMPFSIKNLSFHSLSLAVSLLTAGLFLTGCSSTDRLKQSTQYFHAPAQAYNLFLGNTAIAGQPSLRQSCSENGSSLEIIDAHGDYFKVDVINLLAKPKLRPTSDKASSARLLREYYTQLYRAPASNAQLLAVDISGVDNLYIPLELAQKQVDGQTVTPVLGMLVFAQDDFLFNIQHMQNHYQQAQMLAKLKTLRAAMDVPGRFPVKVSAKQKIEDIKERFGFMPIDPNSASSADITNWRKNARCF